MIDATALGTLVVLALIDSTSFGTLLIPIWLLTAPGRLRLGRMLVYLSTVTIAYLTLGIVLLLGAGAFLDAYGDMLDSSAFLIGQLLLGVALMVVSHLMDTKKARARAAERAASGGGRVLRWRARIMSEDGTRDRSTAALAGLALTAVAVEAASMLPYLAAIGILTSQGPGWPASGVLLTGYCLVMIAPALVLTFGRVVAHDALERPLSRLDRWLTRHAQATTAWILGIIGFLLAAHAIFDLGWFGA
ncbi:GAP family protein [uncultured Aeromicrobium sp.]|uniref:GAP family protein n=1 Tax=uncultured Aeromicrobium sp. TaxID=337820 RepID=UPI0025EC72C9|nr:GAP family protein [uncultured Aeromicrobium sp.]